MIGFQAVLFDYGHTLVDLRWDEHTLIAGERRLLAALAVSPEALEQFHADTGELLGRQNARPSTTPKSTTWQSPGRRSRDSRSSRTRIH